MIRPATSCSSKASARRRADLAHPGAAPRVARRARPAHLRRRQGCGWAMTPASLSPTNSRIPFTGGATRGARKPPPRGPRGRTPRRRWAARTDPPLGSSARPPTCSRETGRGHRHHAAPPGPRTPRSRRRRPKEVGPVPARLVAAKASIATSSPLSGRCHWSTKSATTASSATSCCRRKRLPSSSSGEKRCRSMPRGHHRHTPGIERLRSAALPSEMPTSTRTARRNHQRSIELNRCPARQPIELALPLIGLPAVASSYAAWQKGPCSSRRRRTTGIGPTVWTDRRRSEPGAARRARRTSPTRAGRTRTPAAASAASRPEGAAAPPGPSRSPCS